MNINTLKEFYDFLENDYQIHKNGYHFNSILNSIRDKYKKSNFKDICIWEQWFLDFMLVGGGNVSPKHTYPSEDGSLCEYPSFTLFTSTTYKYLENRANQVNNKHLKARYFHLLVGSNKKEYHHHRYTKNTIDLYLIILQDKDVENYDHIALTVIQNVLYLCYKINYKVTDTEKFIEAIIKNNNLPSWWHKNLIEILLKQ